MKVYALVGTSGTGKSHQAMNLAYEHKIETVIDDGLLIYHGQRVAGASAKGEATALKAVKRAIFIDDNHTSEVVKKIKEIKPSSILVLGTSQKMVDRIVDRLNLPPIEQYFYIEEVVTEQEIKAAQNMRNQYGMHVIPVPMVEVKDDLPGYLINPLRYFLGKKPGQTRKMGEKTIVQPKFSAVGKLTITNHALSQMSHHLASEVQGVSKIKKTSVEMKQGKAVIVIELDGLLIPEMRQMPEKIQALLHEQINLLTGIEVDQVHVRIRSAVKESALALRRKKFNGRLSTAPL